MQSAALRLFLAALQPQGLSQKGQSHTPALLDLAPLVRAAAVPAKPLVRAGSGLRVSEKAEGHHGPRSIQPRHAYDNGFLRRTLLMRNAGGHSSAQISTQENVSLITHNHIFTND